MATIAITLPRSRRTPRNRLVAGRAPLPEIYFVKRIDNSRLRREVDLEKRRQCFCLLGLGILAFFFAFLYAHQHFQCVRYGYQTEQLKSDLGALEEWNRELRLEQASLADPQRIDTLARGRLGFIAPDPHQIVHVGGGQERAATSPKSAPNPELAHNLPVQTGEPPTSP